MKSKMISNVYVEPCGWQGQNGHTTYRGIKWGIRISFRQTDFLLLSFSLDTWLTWPSEEASSANPRRVFAILQAQTQTKGRPWWCHVTGPKIASTEGINLFYKESLVGSCCEGLVGDSLIWYTSVARLGNNQLMKIWPKILYKQPFI
jgi:hypothetical protein